MRETPALPPRLVPTADDDWQWFATSLAARAMSSAQRENASRRVDRLWLAAKILAVLCAITPFALIGAGDLSVGYAM